MSDDDTIIEVRGNHRASVRWMQESSDMKPEGDYFGYMFYLDRRGSCDLQGKAHSMPDEDFSIGSAWERWADMKLVERYLRMFWDVVGFGYFDTQDGKFINVVTLRDLTEVWGFTNVEEYREKTGNQDPSDHNLDEWRSWVDGDVYGYVIEKRVHWATEDDGFEDHDTWEEIDSSYGFYGDEYVKQAALEALDGFAPKVSA